MAASSIHQPRDPNTLANYSAWRTKHTTANFEIDFEVKRLVGSVTLTLQKLADHNNITLDTSHLDVTDVEIDGSKVEWELAARRTEPYGTPLTIKIDNKYDNEHQPELDVTISVQTTKDCTALQWLAPAQTSNKKHPCLFSQCQAIHARSLFPCQDTPDVKSTYTFNIRSPLPVLASGLPTGARDFLPGKNGQLGTLLYTFHQAVPMPSHLFALASGDLASASIGPRSTVWTGPEELTASQWEFERDTETYIQHAEKLVYPYAWTTYNVLVLPPSFPFGGMENPIYTFSAPTVVSGDRENVDVIAHELSHSWSGNLVSCASWEHFWLNEGWTTYLERRLQASVHGDDKYRDFSAILGWKALEDSIAQFGEGHDFTKLIPDLKGRDPDDAFSSVPYEKGFVFLYYLEHLVGKEDWDTFIPHYFTTFQNKSVDSYDFKACLLAFFSSNPSASKKLQQLDWHTWCKEPTHSNNTPWFPPKPDFDTTLADACLRLAGNWHGLAKGDSEFQPSGNDIALFSGQQNYVFLEAVQAFASVLSPSLVAAMGREYKYAESGNVELTSRFFILALMARAREFYAPAARLAASVGRMKFVRPLYKQLITCDEGLAKRTFEENREFYHPICRGMVEKLFAKNSQGESLA